MSWLPLLFPWMDNYTAMRAVRALRPLRTINRLPGMQHQVNTLFASLPHLLDVALLSTFIMVVFGVLGLQLFKGTLRLRWCVRPRLRLGLRVDLFKESFVYPLPSAASLPPLFASRPSHHHIATEHLAPEHLAF